MTSLREQWVSLITGKINNEISLIMKSAAYKEEERKAELSIYLDTGVTSHVLEYEKVLAELQELDTKQKELNKKREDLWKVITHAVDDIPERFTKPGDKYESWRSVQERLDFKIMIHIINNTTDLNLARLKKMYEQKSSLDTQFLIATTPKQLKEAAESILKDLGWSVEDLK